MTRRFVILAACAALLAAEPARRPLDLRDPVLEKNFYLLMLLHREPAALRPAQLTALSESKLRALRTLERDPRPLLFTPDEIESVSAALTHLPAATLSRVATALRASGHSIRNESLPDAAFLAKAWIEAAGRLNLAIEVYGLGKPPRYPAIDSVSFDANSESYRRLLHILATVEGEREDLDRAFFAPTLHYALALMRANQRDEAGRFEPMEKGENAAAYARIAAIDWKRYPYSAIVVPGSGTDRVGFAISPWGRARAALAARRYQEGKAPFLIVSGGFVHPNQTPHCEAIEMKRVLMAGHGVPAAAILIDPHARHTTTNLRNAARLLYRYGFPFDKPALITTDLYQSGYIEASGFAARCAKELGYQPGALGKRLTPSDIEWTPSAASLQADDVDLLDP